MVYEVYTDASLRNGMAGIGFVIINNEKTLERTRKNFITNKDSNVLEAVALKEALKRISEFNLNNVTIKTDSKAIINEIHRIRKGKKVKIKEVKEIFDLLKDSRIKIEWIPRKLNKEADRLSRQASSGLNDLSDSNVHQDLKDKNIKKLRRIIKYSLSVFKRCHSCKERKAVCEFSRNKPNNICKLCKHTIKKIQH